MTHLPAGRSPALPRAGKGWKPVWLGEQTHSHLGVMEPVSMFPSCLPSVFSRQVSDLFRSSTFRHIYLCCLIRCKNKPSRIDKGIKQELLYGPWVAGSFLKF